MLAVSDRDDRLTAVTIRLIRSSLIDELTSAELPLRREGAGRELHQQGEESSAVFSGLQGNGTFTAGRYS